MGVWGSTAPATDHGHVLVVFEHDLVLLVQVEHRDGGQLGRDAAGLRRVARTDRVDQRLDDRVVRRVQMVRDRKLAVALAVERFVPGRCHDPVAPADVAKVHVEWPPLAQLVAVLPPAIPHRRPARPVYVADRVPDGSLLVPSVVRVREQQRLLLGPLFMALVHASPQPDVVMFRSCSPCLLLLPLALARHLDEQAVVLLGVAHPPVYRRQHVHTDWGALVDSDRLGVDQQEAGRPFALDAGPDDVVHQDLVHRHGTSPAATFDGVPVQRELGRPQLLVERDVRDVEHQPEAVVMPEAVVYMAFFMRETPHGVGVARVEARLWHVDGVVQLVAHNLGVQLLHRLRYHHLRSINFWPLGKPEQTEQTLLDFD